MPIRKPKTSQPTKNLTPDGVKEEVHNIATEAPIALVYNGVSHVVMMITPADMEDFVIGFSLSEEIVVTPSDITGLEIEQVQDGYLARMDIPKENFDALLKRDRKLVGQTGCGLCGVAELDDAIRSYDAIKEKPRADKKAIFRALVEIGKHQPLNQETGAVHGAAFVDNAGAIQALFEDVGRHNAFDKLIGHLVNCKKDVSSGFVLLTSRCSFELVQKALSIGVPLLVTISAPTDLAIKLAKDHDLTLVSLARSDSMLAVNDPFDVFL